MSSAKKEDQKNAPEKAPRKGELSSGDLDKVTGGMKKAKTGRTGDPCAGGE